MYKHWALLALKPNSVQRSLTLIPNGVSASSFLQRIEKLSSSHSCVTLLMSQSGSARKCQRQNSNPYQKTCQDIAWSLLGSDPVGVVPKCPVPESLAAFSLMTWTDLSDSLRHVTRPVIEHGCHSRQEESSVIMRRHFRKRPGSYTSRFWTGFLKALPYSPCPQFLTLWG